MQIKLTKRHKILLSFFCVPILHGIILLVLYLNVHVRLKGGEIFRIGEITSAGGSRITVKSFIGDIFDPHQTHPDIRYDIVPVTCVIDPLYIIQDKIVWENNMLLRSALHAVYPDQVTFEMAVRELVATMSYNKSFIQYFLDTPSSVYKSSDDLRTKNKAYIWDVPQAGNFYHKARIKRLASIPIFSPSTVQHRYSSQEIRERLKDNVSLVLQRLLQQISEYQDPQENAIAFAAYGGSSRQQDSHMFLTYAESFMTIYDALAKSRPPFRIDTVYLVVYKNLAQINALADAIDGIYAVYVTKLHREAPDWLFPLPLLVVIGCTYWFTHPKRPNQLKHGNQLKFYTTLLALVGLFAPSLYFVEPSLFNALVEHSVWLVVLSHCILSYLAYYAFICINRVKN